MTYEEMQRLVIEYGNACENFGDYQSRENLEMERESYNKLLEEIKKLLDKLNKE